MENEMRTDAGALNLGEFGYVVNQGVIRRATVSEAPAGRKRVRASWYNSRRLVTRWVTPTTDLNFWVLNPNTRLYVGPAPEYVADGVRLWGVSGARAAILGAQEGGR